MTITNMRQLVRDGYNQCADDYSSARDRFKNRGYLDDLDARLTAGSRVLDIGCGAGVPIDAYLISKGHRLTGMDVSERQVELARENVPQGRFLVGDMSELHLPEESFEAVVSFYAIFHVPREEHLDLFARIWELLEPGGLFLATLGYEDREGAKEFHGATMYWSHYGKDKNLELVQQAGFEILESEVDESGGEHHLVVLGKKPGSGPTAS